jgi:tetratricopeptide (TPR) repeat protein
MLNGWLVAAVAAWMACACAAGAQCQRVPGVPCPCDGAAAWFSASDRGACGGGPVDKVAQARCRAMAALENGYSEEAITRYKQLLRMVPEDESALLGLAYANYDLGYRTPAHDYADRVIAMGGGYTPTAILLRAQLDFHEGCYQSVVDGALALAKYARARGLRIMEIDAYLWASRVSDNYLDQPDAARRYLAKAKGMLRESDREVAIRVAEQEKDMRRWRDGRW